MQREIIFRGHRVDNKEFIYGWLSSWRHYSGKKFERVFSISDEQDNFLVIPETVGQFTGLKDKKGNKIFENDILKGGYNVVFKNGCYGAYHKDNVLVAVLDQYLCDELEIIGNIHD